MEYFLDGIFFPKTPNEINDQGTFLYWYNGLFLADVNPSTTTNTFKPIIMFFM